VRGLCNFAENLELKNSGIVVVVLGEALLDNNSYSFIPATTVIQPHWQARLATISPNSLSWEPKEK
jgi:hypothetical protein